MLLLSILGKSPSFHSPRSLPSHHLSTSAFFSLSPSPRSPNSFYFSICLFTSSGRGGRGWGGIAKPAKSSAEDEIRTGELRKREGAESSPSPSRIRVSVMESLALTAAISNGHPVSSASAMVPMAAGSGGQMVSSPCAGCKFLRRKCQPDCVFAPYFPPDNPQRFVNVHRVFGASNVTKILNELHPFQREDAVNTLAYEADMRLKEPVYGCVGIISLLQHQLRQLQLDLSRARSELSKYQSVAAGLGMEPIFIPGGQQHHHQQQQQQRMAMTRGYAAAAAELGGGGGDYEAGLMTAMASGTGTFGGKFVRPSAAGGNDRQSTLGSM